MDEDLLRTGKLREFRNKVCAFAMYHVQEVKLNIYFLWWNFSVFTYDPTIHNVVAVNRGGYSSCITPAGARVYKSGNDQIKLSKGQNFFICNVAEHCESGMKIAINAAWRRWTFGLGLSFLWCIPVFVDCTWCVHVRVAFSRVVMRLEIKPRCLLAVLEKSWVLSN